MLAERKIQTYYNNSNRKFSSDSDRAPDCDHASEIHGQCGSRTPVAVRLLARHSEKVPQEDSLSETKR